MEISQAHRTFSTHNHLEGSTTLRPSLSNTHDAIIKFVFGLFICLVATQLGGNVRAQTSVGEDDGDTVRGETQYRPEVAFKIKIYKDLEATIETRAIVRRREEEFRDRYSLTYTWQPSKYVQIEPEYLFQAEREVRGETEFEHRLRFSVTGILPLGKWKLSNRNLIERRYIEGERSFLYRNRPALERDDPAHLAIQPCLYRCGTRLEQTVIGGSLLLPAERQNRFLARPSRHRHATHSPLSLTTSCLRNAC